MHDSKHRQRTPGRPVACLLLIACCFAAAGEAQIYQTGLITADRHRSALDTEVLTAATTAFLDSKRFQVIERARMDAIFTERDLQDFINGTPGDLSHLEGVDLLGLVSYSVEVGEKGQRNLFINVRLTDVKTGRVFANASSRRDAFEPPTTAHLAGRHLLANLREAFPPEGIVVNVSGRTVIIDLGVESGIADGDELEVIRKGEVYFHPESGDPLPAVEHVVGVLKVKEANHQMSTCQLKQKVDSPAVEVKDRVRLRPRNEMLRNIYSKIPFVKRKVKEAEDVDDF